MSGLRRNIGRFFGDRAAAASLEYVLLLLPLLALVFTSFQIALAYHFALTAQKAVEQGARIAAVRDAVHTGLPQTNTPAATAATGAPCATGNCQPPGGPWVCSGENVNGGDCDARAYAEIYNEVARIAYLLQPNDMTITYTYAGLGFANGPFVPIVEVEIRERPFFLQFFFNLALLSSEEGAEELQLPAVAASAIAEDLSD